MIALAEFRNALRVLTGIAAGHKVNLQNSAPQTLTVPLSIAALNELREVSPNVADFIHEITREKDYSFQLPRFSPYPLAIEQISFKLEDPPLCIKKGTGSQPLLPFSSLIILTEYAYHLYLHSQFTYDYPDIGVYQVMRQYFTLLCKESGFPNKIWVSNKKDCFILVNLDDKRMLFVANSEAVLKDVLETLQLNVSEAPTGKPFQSDILKNAFVNNNIVTGFIMLPGRIKVLRASVLSEEQSNIDVAAMVENAAKVAKRLTPDVIERVAAKLSAEITIEAHSQASNLIDSADEIQLIKSLQLTSVEFIDDDILLVFESKAIFPRRNIYAQLNKVFDIEDISIN